MEDMVLLVFQDFLIYRRGGWSQSFTLKIFFSFSLGGGGRCFSVPSRQGSGSVREDMLCDHNVCGRTRQLAITGPKLCFFIRNSFDIAGGDRWRSMIRDPQCTESESGKAPGSG